MADQEQQQMAGGQVQFSGVPIPPVETLQEAVRIMGRASKQAQASLQLEQAGALIMAEVVKFQDYQRQISAAEHAARTASQKAEDARRAQAQAEQQHREAVQALPQQLEARRREVTQEQAALEQEHAAWKQRLSEEREQETRVHREALAVLKGEKEQAEAELHEITGRLAALRRDVGAIPVPE